MKTGYIKGIILSLLCVVLISFPGCDDSTEELMNGTGSSGGGTTGGESKLSTPASVSATDGDYTNKIVVTWNKVTGAAQYNLYRAESASGDYTSMGKIEASDSPFYIESDPEKEKEFFYRVRALSDNDGVEDSDLSESESGYARNGAPTVQNLSASDGAQDATIGLLWDEVESATSYKIYRSLSIAGPFEEIAEIDTEDLPEPGDPVVPTEPETPGAATSEITTNVDLSGGILVKYLYTYRIRLRVGTEIDALVEIKNNNFWSWFSGGVRFYQEDVIEKINDAVGFELASAADSGDARYVTLTYNGEPIIMQNDTTNSPIAKFYLSAVGAEQVVVVNGEGTTVLEEADYTGDPADYITGEGDDGGDEGDDGDDDTTAFYFYEDSAVERDVYYYYTVTAIDADGIGDQSDPDYGYCGLPPAPAAPVNVSASDGTSQDRIVVTWGAGVGAETYTVYRAKWQKTNTGSGYVIEAGTFEQIASGLTDETYTDAVSSSNVLDPGNYYYYVLSVSSTGTSDPSETDTGYRSITDEEFVSVYRQTEARLMQKIEDKWGSTPIGSETFYGDINGYVDYSSTFTGGSTGKVTVPYTDYVEFYTAINGSTYSEINIWSPPGETTGTLTLTGIYSGTIDLYLEVKTSGTSGGYYMVTQEGQTQARVDWTE